MTLHILNHHNRIVDDQSHRKHDRQEGQKIQRESHQVHQDRRADERYWHRDQRDNRCAYRAHKQKHHDPYDRDGLQEGLGYLRQRISHEPRGVISQIHFYVRR